MAAAAIFLGVIVTALVYKLKVDRLKGQMRSQGMKPGCSRAHLESTRYKQFAKFPTLY
jgi:hypothetical protein